MQWRDHGVRCRRALVRPQGVSLTTSAAWCHGGATVAPREHGDRGALRAVVHAVTRTTPPTYACPKNEPHDDTSIPQREEPRAAMDTPHMPTMLETWSALRVAYADLPAATIAARLLLDSRVVDVPRSSNPMVVILSSSKPFFFNGFQQRGVLLGP